MTHNPEVDRRAYDILTEDIENLRDDPKNEYLSKLDTPRRRRTIQKLRDLYEAREIVNPDRDVDRETPSGPTIVIG